MTRQTIRQLFFRADMDMFVRNLLLSTAKFMRNSWRIWMI